MIFVISAFLLEGLPLLGEKNLSRAKAQLDLPVFGGLIGCGSKKGTATNLRVRDPTCPLRSGGYRGYSW